MEAYKLEHGEKREALRYILEYPIPIAIKSDFSKAIYRNFLMKNYSDSGAWLEFPYSNINPEYALLPILIHKHQRIYYLYFNTLKYKDTAVKLQKSSHIVDQNLWLELLCEIKRSEKKKNCFGLGVQFLK